MLILVVLQTDQAVEICDNTLNVQYVNRAYESATGYRRLVLYLTSLVKSTLIPRKEIEGEKGRVTTVWPG